MTDIIDLIGNLSREPAVLKPAPHPYVRALRWGAGLAVYIALMALSFGLRDDLGAKFHDFLFVAELASLLALIVSSTLASLFLSYPDAYQKDLIVFAPLPLGLVFLDVLLMEWFAAPALPMPAHGMDCLTCIAGLALLPGLFLFRQMRHFAVTHYYKAGAIAAVAAFSIGAFIFRLSEKTDLIAHLMLWHYAPMLAVAVAGIAAGRILLKW